MAGSTVFCAWIKSFSNHTRNKPYSSLSKSSNMNIQNIIFYNTLSKKATVIGCALCLGMLALPMGAYAQDDETVDEVETTVRKSVEARKVYPTRSIKGRVL